MKNQRQRSAIAVAMVWTSPFLVGMVLSCALWTEGRSWCWGEAALWVQVFGTGLVFGLAWASESALIRLEEERRQHYLALLAEQRRTERFEADWLRLQHLEVRRAARDRSVPLN